MKVTKDEYRAMQERVSGGVASPRGKDTASGFQTDKRLTQSKDFGNGVGNPVRSPYRSRLEQAYAGYLHVLMLSGEIQRYAYEPIRLNLAPKTTLTPDFLVVNTDGSIEFHETKGWAREDAMVKLKIAARLYPQWKFWLVKRKRGVWEQRELPV